jgi:uncharacterized repeat protein (TIGR01451 family)
VKITINGTLAPGTGGQTIADAATVSSDTSDPEPGNNTASFSQLIGPAADLTIAKKAYLSNGETPVTNPLAVGETFIYALHVTNNGPSTAEATVVTDPLPTGITVTGTLPAGCSLSVVGPPQTVTCAIGTLPAGETVSINLSVLAGPSAANTAPQNTATVSSPTPDPNPEGKLSASTSVGVGEVANLALAKSVSPQSANVGEEVTYSFGVTNNVSTGEEGGTPTGLGTTGGVVTDVLPAGLQFVAPTSGSSCSETLGPPATVTCNVGPVAPGETVNASFIVRVTPAAAGTILQNTASVATAAADVFPALADIEPADDTDHASLTVNPLADLSLAKTVSNSEPRVDDEVDYTLTASNAGPNEATGVKITDSLPPGLDFMDASPGCDNDNGTVTCDVGAIASGGNSSVTIRTGTTAALAGTSVGNLASVAGEQLDPNPANNQASATINVQPFVDLKLTKVASNASPTVGGPVTYTLLLLNKGPSPASGVTITDPLPAGLSSASASSGQGSCGASGQVVACHLETLAAGGAALVTVTANVASSAAGSTIMNTARASSSELTRFPDLIARPELLGASASIKPVAAPPAPLTPADADLAIAKTVNHASARVGESLTYTITVTNNGPATASSPSVTDTVSAPVEVASVTTPEGSCSKGATSVCRLGSLASGATAKITLLAKPTVTGKLRNRSPRSRRARSGGSSSGFARRCLPDRARLPIRRRQVPMACAAATPARASGSPANPGVAGPGSRASEG